MSSAPQTDEVPMAASSLPASAVPAGDAVPNGQAPPTNRTNQATPAADGRQPDQAEAPGRPARGRRLAVALRGPLGRDAGVCAAITLFAAWLGHGLWPDPATRALALNRNDQALVEWALAHGTRLYTGDFQLVTGLLNAPDGVNLMANASFILLGAVFAPVTLAFGAPVSFALIMTINLAATGVGWYLLLARTLRLHRLGAALGGAFAAFAPGMVSQANGHLHMTAQWLVPPIVWCVLRLARLADEADPRSRVRLTVGTGALLGGLVTLQVFLGEEVLFLAALTLALSCLVYAVFAYREALRALPTLAGGLAVAAVLSSAVLAYPLWVQFAGRQSVPNGPFNPAFFSADLLGFVAVSPLSLAGDPSAARLVTGPAEYSTFFGVPLLLILGGIALWLWRRPAVLTCAITAMLMCAFALGPQIVIGQVRTTHPGPYVLLAKLPLVDSALPSRLALPAISLFAIMLATAVHVALTESYTLRLVVPVALVAGLVPIAPSALQTIDRPAVPAFFTGGYWRACVAPGGVLVPVPLPDARDPDAMRWAAAADDEFAIPQGWFIAPYAAGGQASVGIYPRSTSQLLDQVAATGVVPDITDEQRSAAAGDLAYWHAACLVLAAGRPYADALKSTVDKLVGPGTRVADVWTWRVTP